MKIKLIVFLVFFSFCSFEGCELKAHSETNNFVNHQSSGFTKHAYVVHSSTSEDFVDGRSYLVVLRYKNGEVEEFDYKEMFEQVREGDSVIIRFFESGYFERVERIYR